MNILFVHQNFPGQFKFLAPALARAGHQVVAMTMKNIEPQLWQGVRLFPYRAERSSTAGIHPWVTDFETKVIRGDACFRAALQLRSEGFTPQVIVAHPGWGESLFLKDVWPNASLGIYCEFFYQTEGADTGFDPEFTELDEADVCRLRLKNLTNLLHMGVAKAGIAPTEWQASTFPSPFRDRISVIHDGIDTQVMAPDPAARLSLQTPSGLNLELTRGHEIITFVNRNLEPYRGFHVFMRALPALLRQRPNARVLLVGGNQVSYGAKPSRQKHGADTWKEIFVNELRAAMSDAEWQRVHFVGNLPYTQFKSLLQLSTVHVYLTYPFVLSWSLLEAMSIGCAIVASDTKPLHEAIRHDVTGRLFDFFDRDALVKNIVELLESPAERQRLGENARRYAREHYDLASVCLPKQLNWVQSLVDR